jgi:CRISPR-associated endonuclease/helicase Cas3
MDGSPDPSQFWAKLRYRNDDRSTGAVVEWHPLLAHSADVAAVTEALLTRTILRDRLASLVGWDALSDVHVARLSALAALHDAGKVNHGFQNRAHGARPRAGHVRPMIDTFAADRPVEWIEPLGIRPMLGWFPRAQVEEASYRYLLATWGHHGQPIRESSFSPTLWREDDHRPPQAGLERLAEHTRRWFPRAFEGDARPLPTDPPFVHAYNGVLTLADWIGSDDDRFFPFAGEDEAPMDRARERAARAMDALFLDAEGPRAAFDAAPTGFDGILENPDWDPYPIQEAVLDQPAGEDGGLTVLESDTGSGKTEAALARFVRLYRAGLVDGMYFAVPTRSAATQLHGRVQEAVGRVFPDGARPPVVQAVPGYIKADDVTATRLPDSYEVRWDEDVRHRGWAAEHAKRYLAAPIAVGTVDQVLLSGLQVNHAHMRAAALLRHFLVVDEVHASDTYMTRLTENVLDAHLAAGGHALLMSATLGASARVDLTNPSADPPPVDEAAAQAYPLVTHVGPDRAEPTHTHAASVDAEKTVEPAPVPIAGDPGAVARRALDAARDGARVLVIRNLVDDARETQRALEAAADDGETHLLFGVNGTPAPHHSRFAPDDRQVLDERVEAVFGEGDRPEPDVGRVAVATQTVEQSLDIDADLMLTDLAPMDVLLQRIGRLHRHSRPRPEGYETARCVVLTPEDRDLSSAITGDGQALDGPHGLGTVYDDLRVIEATWRVLADADRAPWTIPADNRTLVERATHPGRLQDVVTDGDDAWREHEKWVLGSELADRQAAGYVELDRSAPFGDELFPDDLDAVKTRLGRDDYQIELPTAPTGPFGAAIGTVSISEWQLGEPPESDTADDVTPTEGGFTLEVGGRRFRYDRFGLHDTD